MWISIITASAATIDEPVDCSSQSERARMVSAALMDIDPGPWRTSEEGWRAMVASTCGWASKLSTSETCPVAATCVRLHGEDRFATLSASAAQARALDLARLTGRWSCRPEASDGCAARARAAEDERLMEIVSALADAGSPVTDAQRQWFSYRDAGCEAESSAQPSVTDWSRDACTAVLSHRRGELLMSLASADASVGPRVQYERWRYAQRASRGPWRSWLEQVGESPQATELLRELLEAHVDGAVLPMLSSTEAYGRCADVQTSECASAIRSETSAMREVEVGASQISAGMARAEQKWRAKWCGALSGAKADLCEAGIDQTIASVLAVAAQTDRR